MKKWFAYGGIMALPLVGMSLGWGWRLYRESRPFAYVYAPIAATKVVGRLEREIAFFQGKVSQNPDRGLDRAALAEAYLKMARATGNAQWYLLADRAAEESLARLPLANGGAILVQAQVAEARHDFREAIRLAQRALAEVPGARSVLVSSYLALGELGKAEVEAERLVQSSPGLAALTMRGLVRSARGKDDLAQRDFELAIAREDVGEGASSARARTFLGRFHAQRGNHRQAKQLFEEALHISPRYPLAIVQLATLLLRQGKYREADRLYQSIALSPEISHTFDHSALLGRAQVALLRGNGAMAQERLQAAEQLLRTHQDVTSFGHRRELAKILLLQENPAGWREALKLMEAEVKWRRDAETLDTLAWALGKQQKYQQALAVLQEAIAMGGRDAGIYARAATMAQALNQAEIAQQYADRVRQIDPTFNRPAQQLVGIVP